MKRCGNRRSEADAASVRALRSVLRETGGQAKVEELYCLLNAEEAARFLGLAEKSLRNMTYQHEVPHVKIGARAVRYRRIDLIAWQESHFHPAARDTL